MEMRFFCRDKTFIRNVAQQTFIIIAIASMWLFPVDALAHIKAGIGKMDVTNIQVPLVNDTLYAKALILDEGTTKLVMITVDAVSLGEIGYIKNDYVGKVRAQLQKELNIIHRMCSSMRVIAIKPPFAEDAPKSSCRKKNN